MQELESATEVYPDDADDQGDLDALLEQIGSDAAIPTEPQAVAEGEEKRLQELRRDRSNSTPAGAHAVLRTAYMILGNAPKTKRAIYQEIGQARRAKRRTFADLEDIQAVVGENEEKADKAIRRYSGMSLGTGLVVPGRKHPLAGRPSYAGGVMPSPYLMAALAGEYTAPGEAVWEYGPAMVPSAAYVAQVLGRHHVLLTMPSTRQQGPFTRLGELRAPSLVVVPLPLAVDWYSLYQHYRVAALGEETPWAIDDDPEEHPEFALGMDRYVEGVELRLRLLRRQVENPLVAVITPDRMGLPRAIDKLVVGLRWQRVADHWVYEEPRTSHAGDGSPFGGFAVGVWRPR